ncbi:hypothetical protein MT355_20955 [Rathayibacter sp. VKM Ac-2929]|nr:hypothetical protein [Rathayibacter sp. VKM Ac-2929]MCJ1675745.1 hypothetical protein [Rathayibacter sp. VKM Ac-2929]
MADYDDLAASAERGDLTPIAGTVLRGSCATEARRLALLAATGTERL